MDEGEKEEILYRLDTRTKRVDNHLNRLDERVEEVEQEVTDVKEVARSNRQDIETGKGVLGGLGALLSAGLAKLFGVLGL